MNIVDANVLIYAVNADSAHHDEAWEWLDAALRGRTSVGLSWIVLLAFLRIVTHRRLFDHPMTMEQATDQVDAWVASPAAYVVEPTQAHPRILGQLLREAGQGGNLVNDAHLAGLALERRATLVTYDRDFARFPGLEVVSPSDLLS